MGVQWGDRRRYEKWSCQICRHRLGLLERLADVRVCSSCSERFPIIRRAAGTDRARGSDAGSTPRQAPGPSPAATPQARQERAAFVRGGEGNGLLSAESASCRPSSPRASEGTGRG